MSEERLAAYSCGHSAGFEPASLFTILSDGTFTDIGLTGSGRACQLLRRRIEGATCSQAGWSETSHFRSD